MVLIDPRQELEPAILVRETVQEAFILCGGSIDKTIESYRLLLAHLEDLKRPCKFSDWFSQIAAKRTSTATKDMQAPPANETSSRTSSDSRGGRTQADFSRRFSRQSQDSVFPYGGVQLIEGEERHAPEASQDPHPSDLDGRLYLGLYGRAGKTATR